MRPRMIAATGLLAALLAAPAAAQTVVTGTVSAVAEGTIQVDGVDHAVTEATTLQTPAGALVAPHEIRPGMSVEAEVGAAGELLLLKVDLVR